MAELATIPLSNGLEGLPRRPLRRSEFDMLVEAGAFESEPVELLFGEIVPMSPQGHTHAWLTNELRKALEGLLGQRAEVITQTPVACSDESQPEPDIAVMNPSEWRMDRRPERLLLVIEVAHTSQRRDRGPKAFIYARTAIPEYWMLDIESGYLLVHTEPHDDGYGSVKRIHPTRDTALPLLAFPDVLVPIGRLFDSAGLLVHG